MLGAAIEAWVWRKCLTDRCWTEKTGKLVHVLSRSHHGAGGGISLLSRRHQMMPKLRAFIDHVRAGQTLPTRPHA